MVTTETTVLQLK